MGGRFLETPNLLWGSVPETIPAFTPIATSSQRNLIEYVRQVIQRPFTLSPTIAGIFNDY